MIANKVLLKPEIQEQIELFYKISDFLSKYSIIIFSFVFSILLTLTFVFKSKNIVIYTSNILNFSKLGNNFIGKQNPEKINAKSKYLKANYILSETKVNGAKLSLGWGLFKTQTDIQFPSYTITTLVNLKSITGNNIVKILDNYYIVLTKSYYNPQIFKLKLSTKKGITVSQMQDKYNLSCMNGLFNNSFFCNTNKYLLINDIETNKVELSSDAYKKLFDNLFMPASDKCNILKKIYSVKLNYENIIDIVENYCDDSKGFDIVRDLIKNSNINLFSPQIPSTYEGQMHKLVNQWIYLLKTKNISSDSILSHINYVKGLLKNGLIVSNYLYLEYKVLQDLKSRLQYQSNTSSLISSIDKLIRGDAVTGFKGIKSYVKKMILQSDMKGSDFNIITATNSEDVQSVREKFLNLLKGTYKKYFVPTQEPKFNKINKNIVTLVGNLQLFIKENQIIKIYKLPVELVVDLNSIIGKKFTITSVKILDKRVTNYLKNRGIQLIKNTDLLHLNSYFSSVLSDYYLNGQKDVNFTFCDKAKQAGFKNCSNNIISISNKGKLNFTVKFVFNNDRLVKVQIPKKITKQAQQSWVNNKSITINLTKLSDYLNQKLKMKEYTLSNVNNLYSIIREFIKKAILKHELEEVGMSAKQVVKVQSLFKKYLGVNLQKIKHLKDNLYAIYFKLGKYNIKVIYDLSANKIVNIAIYVQLEKEFVNFGNVDLLLSDLNEEKLNLFKQDTDIFLKNINFESYNKLQNLLKKSK